MLQNHYRLLIYVVIMTLATPALLHLHQVRRRRPSPALWGVFWCAVVNTLYLWGQITFMYLRTNLPDKLATFTWFGDEFLFADVMQFLDVALLVGFAVTVLLLLGDKPPRWFIGFGVAALALLPLARLAKATMGAESTVTEGFFRYQQVCFDHAYWLSFVLTGWALIRVHQRRARPTAPLAKGYILICLGTTTAYPLMELLGAGLEQVGLLAKAGPYLVAANQLYFLASMLAPVVWVHRVLLPWETRSKSSPKITSDSCLSPTAHPVAPPAGPAETVLPYAVSSGFSSPASDALLPRTQTEHPTTGFSTAPPAAELALRLGISAREADIARLILEGKSNKDIAVILNISTSTVKNHLYNAFQKLKINSRFELIHKVMLLADNPQEGSGKVNSGSSSRTSGQESRQ